MSNEAAEGDIRTMAGAMASASFLAVMTASFKDSTTMKRESPRYFSARVWPDSPMRTIFLT